MPAALGAFEWTAANLHPAKLGLAILALAIPLGLALYTDVPVTSVKPTTESSSSSPSYVVSTPRGDITTPLIVHATNAHCATLLACLQGLVTPTRAQAHKVVPTPPFSGNNILTHTYSLRFALHHFYSIIQRKSDGAFVLGTSRGIPGLKEIIAAEVNGSKNDQVYNSDIQNDALNNFEKVFPQGRWNEKVEGEGHEYGWTGVIGMVGGYFICVRPSLR